MARADLTAKLWREKTDICMVKNIHDIPQGSNFCNEGGSHKDANWDGL
jgi:hypothetical protein